MKIDIFNLDSINSAITILKNQRKMLDVSLQDSISELTKKGYEYMVAIVPEDTGTLKSSIKWEFDNINQKGIISVGTDYAVFVEYGTGIVGKNSPHPGAKDWRYDINNHGVKGWWYFDDRLNKIRWTRGRAASAFVYKTMKFLEKQAPKGVQIKFNG